MQFGKLGWMLAGIVFVIAIGVPASVAQEPVRYDGYVVARVTIESEGQIKLLDQAGADLLSEGAGLGEVDYVLSPDALAAVEGFGLTYRVLIDDLQKRVEEERARLAAAPQVDVRDDDWFLDYKPHDQILAFLDAWVADYPEFVEKYQLGTSVEGKALFGLTIAGPNGPPTDARPALCFDSMLHAREWVGPMTLLYIMDRLLEEYGTDALSTRLLDEMTFYVAPYMNPDGYIHSWEVERLWRKNRRHNGGGVYGVDLNRNFATGWGGYGSSGDPESMTYRGPSAFSEPESAALRDYVLAHPNIEAHIDFHSYSQLVLRPWGYVYEDPPEPDASEMAMLGDGMAQEIFDTHGKTYWSQPSYQLYLAAGTCADWVYDGAGAFSWTVELRDTGEYGFLLPPEQILPTAEENYHAVRYLADYYSEALRIRLPAGAPAAIPANEPYALPVRIEARHAEIEPGTPRLYARVGDSGAFEVSPLTLVGDEFYEATLPPTACGQSLEYYFAADATDGRVFYHPYDPEAERYGSVAEPIVVVLDERMDADPGWPKQSQWQFGQPLGQGGSNGYPDPTSGFTGAHVYGYNLAGDYANGISERHLTTPALDCSNLVDVKLGFYRWLGVDDPSEDRAWVRVSDDGSDFFRIWRNSVAVTDSDWTYQEFDLSYEADGEPEFYVRWVMGSTSPGDSFCGWNIDDVRIWGTDVNGCPALLGDLNCDDQVNFDDIGPFVLALSGQAAYEAEHPGCDWMLADCNGDDQVDFDDVSPFVGLLTQ